MLVCVVLVRIMEVLRTSKGYEIIEVANPSFILLIVNAYEFCVYAAI